jgi:hypothetical protein
MRGNMIEVTPAACEIVSSASWLVRIGGAPLPSIVVSCVLLPISSSRTETYYSTDSSEGRYRAH